MNKTHGFGLEKTKVLMMLADKIGINDPIKALKKLLILQSKVLNLSDIKKVI